MALVADEQMGEEGQLSSCERCEGGGIASRRGGGKESGMHLNLNSKLKRSPISTNFAGPHMSQ